MTSDRKIKANRENAQASTGPKSYDGRAHSAKNAFRHGLSLSLELDQSLGQDVEAFAAQIAGPYADRCTRMAALKVAEAQFDLRRVRAARHQLLSAAAAALQSPDNLAAMLLQGTQLLHALDRYERRALSRRKFAVRELDIERVHSDEEGGRSGSATVLAERSQKD